MTEEELFKKLLKIEALHSGATTAGEKLSASKAKERILKKIEEYNNSIKNKQKAA